MLPGAARVKSETGLNSLFTFPQFLPEDCNAFSLKFAGNGNRFAFSCANETLYAFPLLFLQLDAAVASQCAKVRLFSSHKLHWSYLETPFRC